MSVVDTHFHFQYFFGFTPSYCNVVDFLVGQAGKLCFMPQIEEQFALRFAVSNFHQTPVFRMNS